MIVIIQLLPLITQESIVALFKYQSRCSAHSCTFKRAHSHTQTNSRVEKTHTLRDWKLLTNYFISFNSECEMSQFECISRSTELITCIIAVNIIAVSWERGARSIIIRCRNSIVQMYMWQRIGGIDLFELLSEWEINYIVLSSSQNNKFSFTTFFVTGEAHTM